MIDVLDHDKICFIGSRVHFLLFDHYANDKKAQDALWPIKAEYNFHRKEIACCTSKDLRIIDAETGRIKRILVGLLNDDDGGKDITQF